MKYSFTWLRNLYACTNWFFSPFIAKTNGSKQRSLFLGGNLSFNVLAFCRLEWNSYPHLHLTFHGVKDTVWMLGYPMDSVAVFSTCFVWLKEIVKYFSVHKFIWAAEFEVQSWGSHLIKLTTKDISCFVCYSTDVVEENLYQWSVKCLGSLGSQSRYWWDIGSFV